MLGLQWPSETGSYAAASERGSYAVEYLGLFPLFLLAAVLVWQVALAGHTLLVAEWVARAAAGAAAAVPWSDVPDRARAVVAAAAPAHLRCSLGEVNLRPVPVPPDQPPLDLLELEVTCQVPEVLRLGGRTVPMPPVTRTVRVPWPGP